LADVSQVRQRQGEMSIANGPRKRTMQTRFGLIEDLKIPLACKAGISYSTVLDRYHRQDSRTKDTVSEMFLGCISIRIVDPQNGTIC